MSIDFGNWAFRNSKLIYFLIAVLIVGGALSAYDMSKLEDPEILRSKSTFRAPSIHNSGNTVISRLHLTSSRKRQCL